ncbi:hypothetical protein ACIQBJ_15065 [Kitasatospora sp. NPDC088391]|uniref:hypothetical protein n=1 Tax=Kitasatospora sp. NPDC088391 TaxID=3364074 RepID=UPI003805C91F
MDTYTGHLTEPTAPAEPTAHRPGDPLPAGDGLPAAEHTGPRYAEDGVCDYEDVILRSVN